MYPDSNVFFTILSYPILSCEYILISHSSSRVLCGSKSRFASFRFLEISRHAYLCRHRQDNSSCTSVHIRFIHTEHWLAYTYTYMCCMHINKDISSSARSKAQCNTRQGRVAVGVLNDNLTMREGFLCDLQLQLNCIKSECENPSLYCLRYWNTSSHVMSCHVIYNS